MNKKFGIIFIFIVSFMLFGCVFDSSTDDEPTGENGFNFESFKKIETYQKLTQEDVDLITSSQIISANLTNWVSLAINAKASELDITVPTYIEWANTYNEEGELVKSGELWNLIQVLNIEAFHTNGIFDTDKLVDINTMANLTESDTTLITTSRIIMANTENIINKCFIEKNDVPLSIPKGVIWENKITEDESIEKAGEFLNIVNILKINAFHDENGFDIQKFGFEGFKNLTRDDTNVLLNSRVFATSMNDIIRDIFKDDEDFYLPSYVKWENENEDGELWKLVQILNLLDPRNLSLQDIQALGYDNQGIKNSDLITSSVIIMANIDSIFSEAVENTSIVVPQNIIWQNTYNEGNLVKEGELLLLIKFLNIGSFQGINGFDTNLVYLDNLHYSDIKEYINDSRIICATTSTLIVDAIHHEHFEIPDYDESSQAIFDFENYLIPSEIHAFLEAGDLVGLIYNQNSSKHLISSNVSTLADNIDKILASAILHRMLSQEVLAQNVVPSDLVIREQFVSKEELRKLFAGLKLINTKGNVIGDIEFSFILSLDDTVITTAIESDILCYVFSKKIIECGNVDNLVNTIDISIYNVDAMQKTYEREKLLLAISAVKASK